MPCVYIAGRSTLRAASDLIDKFGDGAVVQAAHRADLSRTAGNVRMFCHWRQIERLIAALSTHEVMGTVH